MGVGEDHDPLAQPPQSLEKRLRAVQVADHVVELFRHGHDVDADAAAPIAEVRPIQLALDRAVESHEVIAGRLEGQSVQRGVAPGQLLFEEEVVEVAIEQRAVHVEQHVLDEIPRNDVRG